MLGDALLVSHAFHYTPKTFIPYCIVFVVDVALLILIFQLSPSVSSKQKTGVFYVVLAALVLLAMTGNIPVFDSKLESFVWLVWAISTLFQVYYNYCARDTGELALLTHIFGLFAFVALGSVLLLPIARPYVTLELLVVWSLVVLHLAIITQIMYYSRLKHITAFGSSGTTPKPKAQ